MGEKKMIAKPKGTYDLIGLDAKLYNYIYNVVQGYMDNYNYEFIRTPIFEASELFHRGVGETTDIVTKETYDFIDRGERNLTLRPEGTAGVVRSVIENKLYGNQNGPLKYYYFGTMYRYERPQAGRYREFSQMGVEVFNANDPMIDAEVISLGYNLLKELGIENFTVHLNTLGDLTTRQNYTAALKKYLKPHLKELCPDCQKRYETNPLRIIDCKADKDNDVLKNVPKISDYLTDESKALFTKLKELLTILDIDYEIDERIVRGLDYYDYNVWEYVTDEDNVSLGGGGRYNNLVKTLDGPDMPAVGFAFGIDRVITELKNILGSQEFTNNVDVYIMSVNDEEKMQALRIAQDLRLNNVMTEINSNNLSLKSQFKMADSLKAKFLVILNSDDLQKGLVNIKDNVTKEEMKIDEAEIVDWILGNI